MSTEPTAAEIECVARVICKQQFPNRDPDLEVGLVGDGPLAVRPLWHDFRALARVAILTVRQHTDEGGAA